MLLTEVARGYDAYDIDLKLAFGGAGRGLWSSESAVRCEFGAPTRRAVQGQPSINASVHCEQATFVPKTERPNILKNELYWRLAFPRLPPPSLLHETHTQKRNTSVPKRRGLVLAIRLHCGGLRFSVSSLVVVQVAERPVTCHCS